MTVGQAVLASPLLDVAEQDRIERRLADRERRRHIDHAAQLTDVLALQRTLMTAGMDLGTVAQIALVLRCSEHRAAALLHEARCLQRWGALPVMAAGQLTVEQSRVVVGLLAALPDALAVGLWHRLATRLADDAARDVVCPPARVRELLTRWLGEADPDGAAERRKAAAREDADVQLWRREDGLVDLAARALTGADGAACMARLAEVADSVPADGRTIGQRRQAALVDLLLGRSSLPFGNEPPASCCRPGAAAPCGSNVYVHVPLSTALRDATEPADLAGDGPIDGDLLRDLLLSSPVLHRVWIDPASGLPVAVDQQTWRPGRDDPLALQDALVELASGAPPRPERRIPLPPDGHPPDPAAPPPPPRPRVLGQPHLAEAGPYRPSRALRRLVRIRSPRCEWPGCGRRATPTPDTTGCDLDHDLAWPHGPTCGCNLGPLCRRHHRIKQLGWIKRRQPDGSVRWTSPTGSTWTSPAQQERPRPQPHRRQIAPGVWALAA